jgi:hypothetical protein
MITSCIGQIISDLNHFWSNALLVWKRLFIHYNLNLLRLKILLSGAVSRKRIFENTKCNPICITNCFTLWVNSSLKMNLIYYWFWYPFFSQNILKHIWTPKPKHLTSSLVLRHHNYKLRPTIVVIEGSTCKFLL